jgi:hypothetical protein
MYLKKYRKQLLLSLLANIKCKIYKASWVWWHTAIISAFRKLRQRGLQVRGQPKAT